MAQDSLKAEQGERALKDALLQTALDCIISMDAHGRVLEWNPAAERTFGFSRQDALGRDLASLIIPPELRERHYQGLARYLATGEAPVLGRRVELPALHADGTRFPVELAITRLPLSGAPQFTAYLRDITERVRGEKLRSIRTAVIQHLAEASHADDAARKVLAAVCAGLDWENGALWRPDASGEALECVATWQRPGSPAGEFASASIGRRFRRGEGLPGRVWAAGRPAWVRDVRVDPGFPRRELAAQAGLQSALACPITFGGRTLGVVEFFTRHVREPDAELDETIAGVATQLGQFFERRRAEATLRESENRFRALMEQAPFSVQIFAPDGSTLGVNRAWSELWGVTLEQIEGYNILRDPQLEARGVLAYVRRAFAGEAVEIPPIEYDPNETIPGKTRHADPVRWVAAVAYPLKDDAGQVREVVLVHEDITAQRRAEQAVHDEQEKLRMLADTIPQLAWMAHSDGHIFWYNRRWYEYTGTTPEAMEGWGWQSVHDPQVLPEVLARWKDSIARAAAFDMVFPLRGADGAYRPFLTRVNPLRDPKGRVLYWFGTNTDVSEIKRMEDALREADRRKDEFLAMLAHELRNPLAPIGNSLQILRMPQLDAAATRQTLGIMERQFEHLVRLVDELLEVSRVVRGKIELQRTPVALAEVVARAVETAQPLLDAQHHRLQLDLPQEPTYLEGDCVRLAQVLGNLLSNAAKYTNPGGRVRLGARREGAEIIIEVRDNGVGIELELLPRIFDLFVQGEQGAARRYGGLGIGLTLVKRIVELHGGSVSAVSEGAGRGSTFTVRLPVLAAPAASDRPRPERDTPRERRRILVVDDNVDAAKSLATLLRLEGHDVCTAYDGPTALASARADRPQIVFLDLGMPGMDGYAVARELRGLEGLSTLMLVALTGWGQAQDRERSARAGFDHHLVKPADPDRLRALIADMRSPS